VERVDNCPLVVPIEAVFVAIPGTRAVLAAIAAVLVEIEPVFVVPTFALAVTDAYKVVIVYYKAAMDDWRAVISAEADPDPPPGVLDYQLIPLVPSVII